MYQGEILIDCPVERAFDAVADEATPYDSRIVCAEKLTPGPIGLGTRFRSEARSRMGTVPMTVELTGYDRPRSLTPTTRLTGIEIETGISFASCGGGTRMTWVSRARPRGLLRLLAPVIERAGRSQERRVWFELKRALEQGARRR